MFRNALIAINIIAILLALALLSDMSWRNPSGEQYLAVVLLLGVPVMNLFYAICGQSVSNRGLISLYLERKRLEEQMKLEDLKDRSTAAK